MQGASFLRMEVVFRALPQASEDTTLPEKTLGCLVAAADVSFIYIAERSAPLLLVGMEV